MEQLSNDEIRDKVRQNYGDVAESNDMGCTGSTSSCCAVGSNATAEKSALDLGYSMDETSSVPEGANMGLGCGNPQAIAALKMGEVVLDLGSGGGFDSLLAARAVGDAGRVIGVDMTPEMIRKARENTLKSSLGPEAKNVEFRLGEIEHLPVEDEIVDVIISNCVINLSPEKKSVFAEAYRVLKPSGRLAISDIVATAQLPDEIKNDMSLYSNCMAGASSIVELESILIEVGFEDIQIKPKDARKQFIQDLAPTRKLENYVISATIEAVKPSD